MRLVGFPGRIAIAATACAVLAYPGTASELQDLVSRYGPPLEACYAQAHDTPSRKACVGLLSGACVEQEEGGGTTLGISMCSQTETDVWDAILNAEYRQTMTWAKQRDAQEGPEFPAFANRADALRNAQRAWIAFRDAECELEYSLWGAGSMRHIAGSSCLMQQTAQRAIELRAKREDFE